MNNLFDKIEDLGGLKFLNNQNLESSKDTDLTFVNEIMGNVSDIEII
jgi:hypothetical protein